MPGCSLTSWVRTFPFDASSRGDLRQESPPAVGCRPGPGVFDETRGDAGETMRRAKTELDSTWSWRRPLGDHGSKRERGAPRRRRGSVAKHGGAARALGSQVKPAPAGQPTAANWSAAVRCLGAGRSASERDDRLGLSQPTAQRVHDAMRENPGRSAQSWLTLTTSPSDSDPSRREPRGITSESPTHSMVPRSPHRGSR
jgi:hypothetical protein